MELFIKEKILAYAKEFNIEYIKDPTNDLDNFNLRNNVRINLLPIAAKIFPGLKTTVRRLIMDKERKLMKENQL